MKKDNFLMSADWAEAFQLLSDADAGQLIKAIFDYINTGAEPDLSPLPAFAFAICKKFFDANAEKYAAKCEQMRSNGSRNTKSSDTDDEKASASKCRQMSANASKCYQIESDNDSEGDNDGDVMCSEGEGEESACAREDAPSPSIQTVRMCGKYGNVILTVSEYNRIAKKYPDHYKDRIDKFSEYLYEHPGKVYASHYDKIMRWAKEDAVPDWSEKHRSFDAVEEFEKAVEHGRREIKT